MMSVLCACDECTRTGLLLPQNGFDGMVVVTQHSGNIGKRKRVSDKIGESEPTRRVKRFPAPLSMEGWRNRFVFRGGFSRAPGIGGFLLCFCFCSVSFVSSPMPSCRAVPGVAGVLVIVVRESQECCVVPRGLRKPHFTACMLRLA